MAESEVIADRHATFAACIDVASSGSGFGRCASYQNPNAQTPAKARSPTIQAARTHGRRGLTADP